MANIKVGRRFQVEKCYEKNGQIYVLFSDGIKYEHINKAHGRFDFTDNDLEVRIYDSVLDNEYWSVTNELKDGTTEVESTGTVTLDSGATGSVDSITVDGVEITSGVIVFDTDLDTTAAAVVDNINAYQSDYVASAIGAIITLTAQAFDKTTANTFVVVSTVTTIVTTDVNMANGVTGIISDVDLVTDKDAVAVHLAAFVGV